MARVTGIGGVFFKAKDPKALAEWYATHLGMKLEDWGGVVFQWSEDQAAQPAKGATVWHLADAGGDWFAPSTSAVMINYRVDDMDELLAALRRNGVEIEPRGVGSLTPLYPAGRCAVARRIHSCFGSLRSEPMSSGRSSFQSQSSIAGGIAAKTSSSSQLRAVMLSIAPKVTQVRAIQRPIRDQRQRGADIESSFERAKPRRNPRNWGRYEAKIYFAKRRRGPAAALARPRGAAHEHREEADAREGHRRRPY